VNEYLATLDDSAYRPATQFGIILDVEASRAIRQAEVGASRTMIERTAACFGIKPEWLVGDTAYGSAPRRGAFQPSKSAFVQPGWDGPEAHCAARRRVTGNPWFKARDDVSASHDPPFMADFAKAKTEVRRAIRLP
jgi:hypothetical protein